MTLLQRLSAPYRLLILLVVLPFVLMALYLGVFASDRYVSEAAASVRQTGADTSALPGAAMLLAGTSPAARQDALFIVRYAHSLSLLQRLDAELKIREHYVTRGGLDWFNRLAADASQEEFLAYYRKRVTVAFDDDGSILTLRVEAFEPEFAQRLNRRILEESERFVNDSSHQVAREQLRFAETEAGTSNQRVQKARNALLAFQTKNRVLDPAVQTQAAGAIAAELQAMRSRREADLRGLLSYLNDDAPQVRSMRAELQALQAQIDAERDRGVAADRDAQRLNVQASEFQTLRMQADFALDTYKLALTAVEAARIEATRKLKSLVVIEPPSRPQRAEYPQHAYNLVTVLFAGLLLYAVARLGLATIREHQD